MRGEKGREEEGYEGREGERKRVMRGEKGRERVMREGKGRE